MQCPEECLLQGFFKQGVFQIRVAVFMAQPEHTPGFFGFLVQIEGGNLLLRMLERADAALQSSHMQVQQARLQQQAGGILVCLITRQLKNGPELFDFLINNAHPIYLDGMA